MANPPLILIVDDDRFVRAQVRDSLADEHLEIAEAVDGQKALESISARRPDLVVLDLLMPNMSGMEALIEIRKRHPDIPVLVLSSLDAPSMIEEARSHGATDFIGKPFHPLEVVAAVRNLIGSEP